MTTDTERQAKSRKAKKDAGLVRVEVWVPADRVAEVRELADKLLLPQVTTAP